ncbi:hypothetical protein SAMN05421664_1008 [Chryseobacterium soldanellicola]|uniref:Uncharacterized protein n=1 Tax=Chryseobacterium soldanellicola TaxID=311333 RepID=A0A1H0ZP41_9FLAO|nr:hypothetical protein [Chryseobacterium soldanellicola]SDQ29285.1 hypothetical protein SAMN05421664_1008 [Chryseobacterium soldanellicola]
MKKQNQDKKKLSLKKTPLMKLNNMKTITGGGGIQAGFNVGGNDDPLPTPFQTASNK